jgi:hypothetical protein
MFRSSLHVGIKQALFYFIKPEWLSRSVSGAMIFIVAVITPGCSLTPPKPWEKDILARPEMAMEVDLLEQRFLTHIYTSKENASRGQGLGGGGCGCN